MILCLDIYANRSAFFGWYAFRSSRVIETHRAPSFSFSMSIAVSPS